MATDLGHQSRFAHGALGRLQERRDDSRRRVASAGWQVGHAAYYVESARRRRARVSGAVERRRQDLDPGVRRAVSEARRQARVSDALAPGAQQCSDPASMKKLVLIAVVLAAVYFGGVERGFIPGQQQHADTRPGGGAQALATAFEKRQSDVQVQGSGRVSRILADDNQ